MWEHLADLWQTVKTSVVPHDQDLRALVHVHAALAIYLVLALWSRRGLAAGWPVGAVAAMTLFGEGLDLLHLPRVDQLWVLRDTGWDIVNSLVWPVAIMLVARRLERAPADPADGAGA